MAPVPPRRSDRTRTPPGGGCAEPRKRKFPTERDATLEMHLIRNEALSSRRKARSKSRWESRVYACGDHWHITAHEVWLPDP